MEPGQVHGNLYVADHVSQIGTSDTSTATFLLNNLRQARKNIHTLSQELEITKAKLGIVDDEVFLQWRLEELEYLKTLQSSSTSIVEQLEMDYVDTLKRLKKAK